MLQDRITSLPSGLYGEKCSLSLCCWEPIVGLTVSLGISEQAMLSTSWAYGTSQDDRNRMYVIIILEGS